MDAPGAGAGPAGALAGVISAGRYRGADRERDPRTRDRSLEAWKRGVVPEMQSSQEHLVAPVSTRQEGSLDDVSGVIKKDDLSYLDKRLSSELERELEEQQSTASGVGLAL